MLTGDIESEARRVSKILGIQTSASHSLPQDKRAFVEALRTKSPNNCVAMMGDGLNDSPALAGADVGVCISRGFHRAPNSISETTNARISEVIFTSPNLSRLPELLEIAQKTMRQSTWNMRWAVVYNIIAVALAMGAAERYGVVVDVSRAGTMMAFSSVSVLAWSMWLRRDLARVSFDAVRGTKFSV
jgi:P-type E1-E2 ATPase